MKLSIKEVLGVFEDLISTIEKNSVDNKATIENVKLWANSWRDEMDATLKIEKNKKEIKDGFYQGLVESGTDSNDDWYIDDIFEHYYKQTYEE